MFSAEPSTGVFRKLPDDGWQPYFSSTPIRDSRGKWKQTVAASPDKLKAAFRYECAKRVLLNNLFKTLLHQLMTDQLRVNDLVLDALGAPVLD